MRVLQIEDKAQVCYDGEKTWINRQAYLWRHEEFRSRPPYLSDFDKLFGFPVHIKIVLTLYCSLLNVQQTYAKKKKPHPIMFILNFLFSHTHTHRHSHTLKFYILVSANSPFQDFSKILFPFFDPSAFLFYPFPQGLVCYASVSHFCSLSANEQVLFVLTFHFFFLL